MVVGVVVIKLVLAPEQWSIRIGLGRYLKKGTPFLFHRDYNVYVAMLFKLLGKSSQRHVFSAYPTNQVGYKIVIARQPWDLSLKTTARPRDCF